MDEKYLERGTSFTFTHFAFWQEARIFQAVFKLKKRFLAIHYKFLFLWHRFFGSELHNH